MAVALMVNRRFVLRLVLDLVAIFCGVALVWWIMIRMPGTNVSRSAALSAEETVLRGELQRDVEKIAGEIGERNLSRYTALNQAADFIERSFLEAGLQPRRNTYRVHGFE